MLHQDKPGRLANVVPRVLCRSTARRAPVRRGHDREPTAGTADRAVRCVRAAGGRDLTDRVDRAGRGRHVCLERPRHGQRLSRVGRRPGRPAGCRSAPRHRRPSSSAHRAACSPARSRAWSGDTWQALTTDREVSPGSCLANVTELGEFAVIEQDRPGRLGFAGVWRALDRRAVAGRCRRLLVWRWSKRRHGRSPSRRLDR